VGEVVVRWLDAEGIARTGGLQDLADCREAPWRWVDVTKVSEEVLQVLGEEFELHPLLVEDALHRQPRPKLDTFPDGIFLAWITAVRPQGDGIETHEFDAFLGRAYLITIHENHADVVDDVAAEAQRIMALGPDWLLHAIIDRLVDSVLPVTDGIGDELDDLEEKLLGVPRTENLKSLYTIRRQLVQLHRIVAPERDILRGLARERSIVSEEAYRYFQDVADHLAHVEDSIETYRDVGSAAMDIYLSAQSNRMNEIMKQLTVVATIFMPLTLVSGIYGMNVIRGMWPPVTATWSFAAIMAAMLGIGVAMSLYFRRKNWW